MKREIFIIDEERRRAVACRAAGTHKPIEIWSDSQRRGRTVVDRKLTGMLPCPKCGSRLSGLLSRKEGDKGE